ncbi:cereblon family protein [Maridesulfovibrio sp.]|uniref:cereblon family protein n=1 Tax=Maridesulfovibrio sp. TaxID=2795000 RepID=UPI0029F587A4|nr:cereblon family protein [Maridesulfovibrio sp.]
MQTTYPHPPCSLLKSAPPGSDSNLEAKLKASLDDPKKKKVLCRTCGAEITDNSFATRVNNSHEHSFFNPHGYVFQIRCYSAATGCRYSGKPSYEFTWFAGCSWQIAVCKACLSHLGWRFQSDSTYFYGLIRDKLTE